MRDSIAAIRRSKNTLSILSSSSFLSAIKQREGKVKERGLAGWVIRVYKQGKEGRADYLISVKCFVSPTLVQRRNAFKVIFRAQHRPIYQPIISPPHYQLQFNDGPGTGLIDSFCPCREDHRRGNPADMGFRDCCTTASYEGVDSLASHPQVPPSWLHRQR
jgi:hypothetical protein